MRREGITPEELTRMRQRLALIEEQVRSTRLQFDEAVTVRNSTGRSLQLTLNITERGCSPLGDVRDEEVMLNSTFKLPVNAAVSHRFSRNGRDYFDHTEEKEYDGIGGDRTREVHVSPSRGHQRKEEKKFQSSGSRKKIEEEETNERSNPRKDLRIKIEEEEDASDIEEESKVRPIYMSEHHEQEASHLHQKSTIEDHSQLTPDTNNPHHMSTHPRMQTSTKKLQSITRSPQVYSYLNQEYRTHHSDINTSFKKQPHIAQQDHQIDTNTITPLKNRTQQHENSTHRRLSELRAISRQSSASKPHHLQSSSIQPVTHQKGNSASKMKKTWVVVHNQPTQSKSKSHYLSNNSIRAKPKAEQLYKQRKQLFTAAKANLNDSSRHKRDVDKRFNRFVTATRAANDHSLSKRSLSPKVQAITDRLSAKQRSPCGHYRVFSESKERQAFLRLIQQNPVANKYICNEEREYLFQQLRNEPDSVSLWPMKIVNYTYAKVKHSCSVNYAVLKE